MTMVTKQMFDAALDAANLSVSMLAEPRVEVDGNYKYECFDDVDGNEIAWIAWHQGEPTYHLKPGWDVAETSVEEA